MKKHDILTYRNIYLIYSAKILQSINMLRR